MPQAVYGAEAAVEAVREFLAAGTHGGAGSPAQTLNGLLADRRTALGITTAVLPDVAQIESIYDRSVQATTFPYLGVAHDGNSGEADGVNSRDVDHRIVLALVVPNFAVDGDERAVGLAALRYQDAIRVLFFRRTPMPAQGWTLNNGGTGAATKRVIRCAVEQQEILETEATPPNLVCLTRLVVRTQEEY